MDPDRWLRAERVLDRALASDPGTWPALLDDSCRGDAALRDDVESLLAQVPRASRYLASPPSAVASALIADAFAEMGLTSRSTTPPDVGRPNDSTGIVPDSRK